MMYAGDEAYGDDITSGPIAEEQWACPNCGSTTGQPESYDFGIDPDTGYHDAGIACIECLAGIQ